MMKKILMAFMIRNCIMVELNKNIALQLLLILDLTIKTKDCLLVYLNECVIFYAFVLKRH